MTNRQFSCCKSSSSAAMRDLLNLIQLDFQASFGTMACFLERKAAPFGSRPRPMKFKMTNAVIAADVSRDAQRKSSFRTRKELQQNIFLNSLCLLICLCSLMITRNSLQVLLNLFKHIQENLSTWQGDTGPSYLTI